jgi:hypothetical protein
MNDHLLITFGCSWTFGVGVGYTPGMDDGGYREIAWNKDIADRLSYRGLLCDQLGMRNLNFAMGGSSNQAQFRRARRYFGGDDFARDQSDHGKIIVLHAITSTARNFFFDVRAQETRHVTYNDPDSEIAKVMLTHHYDHNFEVQQLQIEMNFWNVFYRSIGVSNLWIDTFNHHEYTTPIDNLVDWPPKRDLLSRMCVGRQIPLRDVSKHYHFSSWRNDDYRIGELINCGLLNPLSIHPTAQGHMEIASILRPVIESKKS